MHVIRLLTVCVLALSMAIAGCSNPEPEVGFVTGTVTLDGKPASRIGIAFIPDSIDRAESSPVATAETDEAGHYELTYTPLSNDRAAPPERKPGATVGRNQIVLEDSKQKAEHLRNSRVLYRYSQLGSSGFQLEVKPGSQVYDIALTSK